MDEEIAFTDLAELLGVEDLSAEEQAAVLDLAKVVAHTSVRRYAPLVAYALGRTIDDDGDDAGRIAAIRAMITRVQRGAGAAPPA